MRRVMRQPSALRRHSSRQTPLLTVRGWLVAGADAREQEHRARSRRVGGQLVEDGRALVMACEPPSGSPSKASAAQLAQRLAALDGVDRPVRANLVALEDAVLGEEADHALDVLIVRRVRVAADLLKDGETVFGGHERTIADFGTRIRVGDPRAR